MHLLQPLLLLASIAPLRACAEPAPARAEKLIFILAGQSNMAGRGGVSGNHWDRVVPPECATSPSVLRLSASLRWETAREPLHADIDVHKTCGVGPGMAFANAIRPALPENAIIGLVPCAVGGTRIRYWARGTPLYESVVRRSGAALAAGGGRLGAMLWYQGESDTLSRADAEAYGARMQRMVRDLRADLGVPDLLVIQVALASAEGKYIERVREAQKEFKLPNVICVDAKGLALEGDHLHLTTEAEVQLGKMLAAAYLNHATSTRGYRHVILRFMSQQLYKAEKKVQN